MHPSLSYSVVIPSRGRREMLLTALESVYAQSVPPREVIVVIDGDVDGSADAVVTRYPHTVVIVHENSLGPARSRSDGLRAATAEWVCLLDDDDIWHSEKQSQFASYVQENPSCRALRSAYWQISENSRAAELNGFRTEIFGPADRADLERAARTAEPLNRFDYLDIAGHSLESMLRKNCGVTSSTMVRKDVLQTLPDVPHDLRTAQDWLLFVFVARETEWHLVPGRWLFYRVHAAQVTSDQDLRKWRYRVKAWEYAWEDAQTRQKFRLRDYASEYAGELHGWVWEAILRRNLSEAAKIYRAGAAFVDSRTLRASVLLPPPVRWRLRHVLARRDGMTDG